MIKLHLVKARIDRDRPPEFGALVNGKRGDIYIKHPSGRHLAARRGAVWVTVEQARAAMAYRWAPGAHALDSIDTEEHGELMRIWR